MCDVLRDKREKISFERRLKVVLTMVVQIKIVMSVIRGGGKKRAVRFRKTGTSRQDWKIWRDDPREIGSVPRKSGRPVCTLSKTADHSVRLRIFFFSHLRRCAYSLPVHHYSCCANIFDRSIRSKTLKTGSGPS